MVKSFVPSDYQTNQLKNNRVGGIIKKSESARMTELNIKVYSRKGAEKALRDDRGIGEIKAMISIADSYPYTAKAPYGTAKVPRLCRLVFDDTSDPNSSWDAPVIHDIVQIINFAKTLQRDQVDGTLLIHCEAGISRSAAAAIICKTTWDGPGLEIESILSTYKQNHKAWPNQLMIHYADVALERDGSLINAVRANPDAELWLVEQELASQKDERELK